SVIARDAAWAAHAGRADAPAIRGNVQANGAKAGRVGGDAACVGVKAASNRATVPPVGGFVASIGAAASGIWALTPGIGGKAQGGGGNPAADRERRFGTAETRAPRPSE